MSAEYTYEDEEDLRDAFWEAHPEFLLQRQPGRQNAQCADVRMAWCDWLDYLEKAGLISEELATRSTL